jgi:hypothetical protein
VVVVGTLKNLRRRTGDEYIIYIVPSHRLNRSHRAPGRCFSKSSLEDSYSLCTWGVSVHDDNIAETDEEWENGVPIYRRGHPGTLEYIDHRGERQNHREERRGEK